MGAHRGRRPPTSVQLPQQDLQDVGGRLRRAYRQWRHVADKTVRSWVRDGFRLDFVGVPPESTSQPVDSAARLSSDPVRLQACDDTVKAYLRKKILEVVPVHERGQGLYQCFFPVPKKTAGEWRGCLDARPVNTELRYEKFKMEGLHTLKGLLRRDDWMTSIDVADAYSNVLLHPEHRQYTRFVWRGVHYQFRAVCFGIASAPRMFTKLLRPVVALLRAAGIRSVIYLDDLLILALTREDSTMKTQFAVNTLVRLGFLISPQSEVDPSRSREFLGIQVDSHTMELHVPAKKIKNKDAVKRMLRENAEGRLTVRQLAGIIGKINALSPAVLPARLLSRHLLFCKNKALALSARRVVWNKCVHLSPEALLELQEWQTLLDKWNGRSVIPPRARHVLTTDASHYGWGAWLKGHDARGFWTRHEASMSSNRRELKTTVLGVQAFAATLAGSTVEVRTDNIDTMAYINHQGGRNPALTALCRPLWDWALRTKTTIFATYIPGKDNVRADRLSRIQRDRTDWMLNRRAFQRLEQRWGPFTIDAFATRLNHLVPRYISWQADPGATFVDALQQNFARERAWANPPFNLILRFLARIKRQRATATIVVPVWPTQEWWPLLGEMLVDTPVLLPQQRDLFLPGHLGNEVPLTAPHWSAIACKISGAPSSIGVFRQSLSRRCSDAGLQACDGATTPRGATGSIFVSGVGFVRFTPMGRI